MIRYLLSEGDNMPSYWINSIPLTGTPTGTTINQLIVDNSGSVIATGTFSGRNNTSSTVMSFDAAGQLLKAIEFDGITTGRGATCSCLDTDGGLIIGGYASPSSPEGTIGKLNADFTLASSPNKRVGLGASLSYLGVVNKIDKSSDGNYIVCLSRNNSLGGVVKYDSSFSNTFVWTYTPTGSATYSGMVQDSAGNIYIGGTAFISSLTRGVLIKLNSSGVEQWVRTQTPSSGSISNFTAAATTGTTLCIDSSDNLYITGCSESNTRCFIASYDTSGVLRWQRQFVVTAVSGRFPSIASDGTNVYVCFWNTASSFTIAKYNSSGVLQWQRSLTSESPATSLLSSLAAITTTDAGQSYLVGVTSNLDNLTKLSIVKLPTDGTLTGTFGGYVYAASSLTEQAGTLTSAAHTMTIGSNAFSVDTFFTRVRIAGGITNVS